MDMTGSGEKSLFFHMLILHNARVNGHPNDSAIAIEQRPDSSGRILAVGQLDQLEAEFPKAAREDMQGRVIWPGLTDAHVHIRQYAHSLGLVNCDTPSRTECLERVAERASAASPGAWILGHGWRQNDWAEGFGTAALLDTVAPRNPVYLTAASLHAGWANSAALKAAGVSAQTQDLSNGQIQRDVSGNPTGIVFEAAMQLVEKAIPEPSEEDDVQVIFAAQQNLWKFGLTGVHDFDRIRSFRALQRLHERGDLKLRVLKNLPVESLDVIAELGLRSGFGDDLLRIGAIKLFADGALGPRTAAMIEPYAGEHENRGMLFMDSEQIYELGQKAAQAGFGLTVHAIGDRANHEVLNAIEQLRSFERQNNLPLRRHRIEHVQILHSNDISRLGQLDVVASMQPLHATSDMHAAETYWGDRTQFSYAWKTQLGAGARLAFGSDAPVESPNPFLGLHAAVTRRRADGSPGEEGWYPKQRLSLQEALAAFTSGPAVAAGMEDRLGSLKPGFLADLIVLENDPFEIDPHDLRHILPLATMVGGEWVWQAE